MIEVGFHQMPFSEYKKIDALNNSTLVQYAKTPLHSQLEKEDTDAMRFGRAFHAYKLETEIFDELYAVMPEKMIRRGSKWETFQEDNPGKEIISYTEYQTMKLMDNSLNSGKYETARNLIENSKKEITVIWKHRKFGILCKGRLDLDSEELGIIADIKTSTTAEPDDWIRIGVNAKMLPHWQVGHYMNGVNTIKPNKYHIFLWILFETKEPFGISVVQATPSLDPEITDMAYLAKLQMDEIIPKYIESKSRNIWGGRPDKIVPGQLPQYYIKNAL